jgi:hypothetical protein
VEVQIALAPVGGPPWRAARPSRGR